MPSNFVKYSKGWQRPGHLIGRLTGFEGDIVWDISEPGDQPHRYLDVSEGDEKA
jgi:hypothetical protein